MPLLTELDDVCGRNSTKMPRRRRWTEDGLVAPKSDEGGWKLFSWIHFGMDDWGKWGLCFTLALTFYPLPQERK
jgi:hypothetical protein